jgi:hypothetical protein
MSEILLGLKLYLGVVLGKLAVIGIVFAVCFVIFILCCIFGKKVDE